jgi:hypothetical protein
MLRQFVAGVHALEVLPTVDVVTGIDQPVRVEHHQRVHTHGAAAAADLLVAVDGALACAKTGARDLTQVHAGYVGDFGGE